MSREIAGQWLPCLDEFRTFAGAAPVANADAPRIMNSEVGSSSSFCEALLQARFRSLISWRRGEATHSLTIVRRPAKGRRRVHLRRPLARTAGRQACK